MSLEVAIRPDQFKVEQSGSDIIFSLSPSSLDSYQECALKYDYSKNKKIRSVDTSDAMERGSVFHKMLELHYTRLKEGVAYHKVMEEVIASIRVLVVNHSDLIKSEDINDLTRVYQRYAVNYATDTLETLEIEAPFSYLLLDQQILDYRVKVIIEGIIDWLVRTRNSTEIVVVDHKTESQQRRYTSLQNSFSIYAMVTGCHTVLVNAIGFQKEPIFRRIPLFYSPARQIEFKEKILPFWAMKLIAAKRHDIWEPNNSSCLYCPYTTLCEADPDAREFKINTFFRKGEDFDIYLKGKK